MSAVDVKQRALVRNNPLGSPTAAEAFGMLFEHMPNGVVYCQMLFEDNVPSDFVYLYTNPSFHLQTGLGPVIGRHASEATPAILASDRHLLEAFGRIAKSGRAEKFEIYLKALGQRFAVSAYCPQTDHCVAVIEVTSDRKQKDATLPEIQQRLCECEARFWGMFEDNDSIMLLIEPETGRVVDANSAAVRFYLYSAEQLKSMSVHQINVSETISITNAMEFAVAHHHNFFVFSHRLASGAIRTVEVRYSPIQMDGKTVLLSIINDISQHIQVEESIRKSQDRLQRAELTTKSGNWELHLDSSTMVGSEGAAKIYGLVPGSFDLATVQAIPLPEFRPMLDTALKRLITENAPYDVEFKLRSMDTGEIKDVHSWASFDKERRILFGVIQDISERKLNEQALRESEERYRLFAENSHDVIWTLDIKSRKFTYVSPSVERLRGVTPAEAMALPIEAALMPESAKAMNAILSQRLQQFAAGERPTSPVVMEIDQPHRDGSIIHTEIVTTILLDDAGQPASVLGVTRDITERKKAQEEQQLAALVYRNSSEAMVVTNADNLIESVNPAFEQITGYTLDEVKGKNPKVLASGRHDKSFYKIMWQELDKTGSWQGEIWNRRKDGVCYLEQLSINTNYAADGSIDRRVALFSDITKKKEAVDLIWRQANFDPLTQLPNRRMFRDRFEQEIKKANRASRQLALLFIDLDHFKEVNDTLGHVKGDQLIIEASRRLVNCVRETDTVARMGGDEFTIILTELDGVDTIERAAAGILRSLAMPFLIDESVVYISASMGVTLYPNDAADIDELLKNVDQAMYVAKRGGRNRYSYFTQHLQKAAQSRLRMITDLHGAVSGNQLRVYFQPIVEMASGQVLKAEALVRWLHPQRGLVSPAEFIPIAEETGLICEVGDWVFQEAMRWTARWREKVNSAFQVSVNRSPVEFANGTSRDSWLKILETMRLPGASVVVEITEGVLVDTDSPAFTALVAYRDSGIQVAIDDFGTGYSSLAYLKKFDIDYLKIDQSFTKNLAVGSSDLALSKAIIVMAHELGLKVIAEGVETTDQRDLLLAAGCDYAQGYLFSKPLPPEEFEAFLLSD